MFTEKLEGTTVLSDSKVTQKSRDSLLLISAIGRESSFQTRENYGERLWKNCVYVLTTQLLFLNADAQKRRQSKSKL